MNFRNARSRRREASLDLTPLIDVIFLLLIFFLVTVTFARPDQSAVAVELPEGVTGTALSPDQRLTITVSPDGDIAIKEPGAGEERFIDETGADRALRDLRASYPNTPLYLRGDRSALYGSVVGILDRARAAGFERIFNVIERSASP